jgi:hypothetical protein
MRKCGVIHTNQTQYQQSRSHSPSRNARDKTRIKALREASKNALFNFKGRTDDDLQTWIYTIDQYLSFLQLKPRDELNIAIAYLKENALQKYICNPNKDRMTWKDLKKILMETYKSIDYQHALRQKLTNLKEMGSIDQYIHDFHKIVSQMDTRAEEFFHCS